jgi:hypothetical protein
MGLPIADALQYVNRLTFFAKDYRNWAVSDFLLYKDWIDPPITTLAEQQKTWALYLKWAALADSNPKTWSSSNGTAFNESADVRKFRYTPGADKDTKPTLEPASKSALPSTQREVTLAGVGQCEYFATQAYQALKAGGAPGKVPRVDKVATPGHNWVLVNYSATPGSSPTWVAVDYWLLALGVPKAKCVCAWDKAALRFSEPFEFVETFNPDKQT